ncbi:MAG: phosphoadenylyl-sulfate reductase [Acidimicrobiales bacterium]
MANPVIGELAEAARRLEGADASEIVRWAADRFGEGLVFTASFEDAVLIDVVAQAAPEIDIVFLDTQYHFAETLWFRDELAKRYPLRLQVLTPAAGVAPDNRWQSDVEGCCAVRKVEPLERALAGRTAWLTGVRRADGPTRANTPVAAFDLGRSIAKINPLAAWTDEQTTAYAAERGLPAHPLADKGYLSIGCWPCTRPVAPGEDRRAGRWAGLDKTECGLHV